MNSNSLFNFSVCQVVNYLWPQFVEHFGIDKTKQAVSQALDLQRMHGGEETIPVLIVETCGVALSTIEILRLQSGIICSEKENIVIISIRERLLQVIDDF